MRAPIFLLLVLRPCSGVSSDGMSNVDGLSGRWLRELPGILIFAPCSWDPDGVPLGERCSGGCCFSGVDPRDGGRGSGTLGAGWDSGRVGCGDGATGEPNEKLKSTSFTLRVLYEVAVSYVCLYSLRGGRRAYPAPRWRICKRSSRPATYPVSWRTPDGRDREHTGKHGGGAALAQSWTRRTRDVRRSFWEAVAARRRCGRPKRVGAQNPPPALSASPDIIYLSLHDPVDGVRQVQGQLRPLFLPFIYLIYLHCLRNPNGLVLGRLLQQGRSGQEARS